MDKQQLIKKNQSGGYQDIYPKTFIDAIRDKESGMSLSDILNGFNMYFLPYVGSPESTRLLVPKLLRRQGLWITYVKYDKTVITEWYAGEDISDKAWKNSSNWTTVDMASLIRKIDDLENRIIALENSKT